MTPTEVEHHMATMLVYWPKAKLEPTTAKLWPTNLAKLTSPDLALNAISRIMETSPYWPHWSDFMKVYRDELAAERRDTNTVQAVTAPPPPPDRSGTIFAALQNIIRPQPKAGDHLAESLYRMLTDAWGTTFDPDRTWPNRMARMEAELLGATVDAALKQWPTGPSAWRQTSWAPFGNLYLELSDREALATYAAHQQAKATA